MAVAEGIRTNRRLLGAIVAFACLAGPVPIAAAAGGTFSWSGPKLVNATGGQSIEGVACPSSSECVGIDQNGRMFVFNPTAPTPVTFHTLAAGPRLLGGVACPSTSQCTVVDALGHEFTFNPGSPGTPSPVTIETVTSPDAGTGGLACPSATECVTLDGSKRAIVFNPQTPGMPTQISLGASFFAVACASATECTAINDAQAVTFDPTSSATATPATVENNGNMFRIACPLTTQCTAVDQNGSEVTFNPQTPALQTPVKLDKEFFNPLFSLACASATQCTAGSGGGRVSTFNPQSPPTTPNAINIDPNSGGTQVNQDEGILGIACTSTTSCTAVDGNGHALTFNPVSPGHPTPAKIDRGGTLLDVACPLGNQCTAIDDSHEITFAPSANKLSAKVIHRGTTIGFSAIDCASGTQCTAVRASDELTFNPRKFKAHKPKSIDPQSDEGIVDISCLSRSFCVVDDANGAAVSFNPVTGMRVKKEINVEEGESQTAMACPSKTQCTSVDNNGTFITFNPTTGKVGPSAHIDNPVGLDAPSGDSNDELDGIACPTTRLCIAIDTLGNAVRFNPRVKRKGMLKAVDAGNQLHDIACPSTGRCIAVDSAGRALIGNPASNTWTAETVAGAASLMAISCPSSKECVAVDAAGDAFAGRVH
jgi:hypothetical protein